LKNNNSVTKLIYYSFITFITILLTQSLVTQSLTHLLTHPLTHSLTYIYLI